MSSAVCIDASFLVLALVPDRFSDRAETLLAQWDQAGTTLIAPTLLAFEVISTLRRFVYLQTLSPKEGDEALEAFLHIPIRLSARRGIFPLAWRLARTFNRPRAYDTAYLALAQLAGCEFWTADEWLYNSVKDQLAWAKWIGNFHLTQG